MQPQDSMVVLGKFAGAFGVKGWLKVYAFTADQDGIFNYKPWFVRKGSVWNEVKLVSGRRQGKSLVACIEGVEDRDQALLLNGCEIGVNKSQLPQLDADEYYWSDLVGMAVVTVDGVPLGNVDHLLETGANDVVVVKGDKERWLPWIMQDVIRQVDLQQRVITVDWDPEF